MTDKARFLKKKFGGLNLGSKGLNQAQNEVFLHFLGFGSYIFLEIEYDDSLRQYLTSSRGKIDEKNFWAQILAKQVKIGPEIRFFTIFSVFVH